MGRNLRLEKDIRKYLRTGNSDPMSFAVSHGDFLERSQAYSNALRKALLEEVLRRSKGSPSPVLPSGLDLSSYTRERVKPMVAGLFPPKERDTVLALLERSVIFVTPDSIAGLILETMWDKTAWDLANLYLGSLGLEGLDVKSSFIDGLSEGTTCFVSLRYFQEKDPFADYIIHETAHIFHNCKRETVGLPFTRRREWLLEIDFSMREHFAWACEVLNHVAAAGRSRAERLRLVEEWEVKKSPIDSRIRRNDFIALLKECAGSRNGWKRLLQLCGPA